MASTSSVLKPDFAAKTKHFIFTDEHEQLRESIRAFAIKELAPHAEEWEETTFPDSVFRAHGRARLPRPRQARGVRRPGRRLLLGARARRGDRATPSSRRARRWASRSRPTWRCRRSSRSAPRSRSRSGSCRRSAARRSSASGSPSRTPAPTSPGIKTRAGATDGDEYVINGSKTYITNGHRADVIVLVTKTDPDAGYDGFTLFLVPMDAPGVIREKRLREARHARQRHRAARLPGRARARRPPCSARSARASTTSCGSSRASA